MQDLASGEQLPGVYWLPCFSFPIILFFKIRVSLFYWLLALNVLRGRGAVPVLVKGL